MSRRRNEQPGPRRRREDELATYAGQLEELLQHGSRNFRQYRRRAYGAFFLLAVANALAIYLVIHNAGVQRRALAGETRARAAVLAKRAKDAELQAHAACERTRMIVPPVAEGFARTGVLRGKDLEMFRSSIPKHC